VFAIPNFGSGSSSADYCLPKLTFILALRRRAALCDGGEQAIPAITDHL
jgi:hypothetical protein